MKKILYSIFAAGIMCSSYSYASLSSQRIAVDQALKEARKQKLTHSEITERAIILKIIKILIVFETAPRNLKEFSRAVSSLPGERGAFINVIIGKNSPVEISGYSPLVYHFLTLLRIILLIGIKDENTLQLMHFFSQRINARQILKQTKDQEFVLKTMDEMSILVDKLKIQLEHQLKKKIKWWNPGDALTRHQSILNRLENRVKSVIAQDKVSGK
ncbi:MAG: hypothetical protein LBQ08_04510 [Holosporaceae bacterium]|nr:hypothetical protein [Holosporaceae bacterium]